MKKKIISLMMVLLVMNTLIFQCAEAIGNIFVISKAEIVGVENGVEYKSEVLPKGTARAKMKFSNFTQEEQTVVLYIASKEDGTNKILNANTKTVVVPSGKANDEAYIDVIVTDNTKENVYLYIWDEHQSAYCEIEQWTKAPVEVLEVRAIVTGTIFTDARLISGETEKARIDIEKVYNEEDKNTYGDYIYVDGELVTGLKVLVGDSDIENYLGYIVDLDLELTEEEELRVVSCKAKTALMEELIVTKDIETAYISGGYPVFEYWANIKEDSKPTEVDVAPDAEVYLNNIQVGTLANSSGKAAFKELANNNATVRFLGYKDNDFSMIFITQVTDYMMVEEIYADEEFIAGDIGGIELSKEMMGNSFFYRIYKNGERINISDIKKGDVLSVIVPNNDYDGAPYLIIHVSDKTISGTVSGAASSWKYYYIGDDQYEPVRGKTFRIGDTGIFHLTHDGKLYNLESSQVSES